MVGLAVEMEIQRQMVLVAHRLVVVPMSVIPLEQSTKEGQLRNVALEGIQSLLNIYYIINTNKLSEGEATMVVLVDVALLVVMTEVVVGVAAFSLVVV